MGKVKLAITNSLHADGLQELKRGQARPENVSSLLSGNSHIYKVMYTKLVMAVSGVLMAFAGSALIFFSEYFCEYVGAAHNGPLLLILQILGGLYFGFAMLNWTAKSNLIGGIYSRPVAIANFAHFMIGGLALTKGVFVVENTLSVGAVAFVYIVFALIFGKITFWPPQKSNT